MRWAIAALLFTGCVDRLELLGPPDAAVEPDAGPMLQLAATVSVGSSQACATQANGIAFCFGDNSTGSLGLGDTAQRTAPTIVDAGTLRFAAMSVGERHACGLTPAGAVYCWGDNGEGALGTGETGAHLTPVRALGEYRALSSGDGFMCGIDFAGALSCWGRNFEGQLGQAGDVASPTPQRVGTGTYTAVAAGQGHACGLATDGGLECWGRNSEGQLGSGSGVGQHRGPTAAVGGPWLSVSATQGSTCAIRSDRTLWCWGEGPSLVSRTPVKVGVANDWTQVSVNQFHFCGRRGADLYCWGRGIEGQLGLGDNDPRPEPVKVPGAWSTVASSRFSTCGIQTDGRLYCWGKNDFDELGTGDTQRRSSPTQVVVP